MDDSASSAGADGSELKKLAHSMADAVATIEERLTELKIKEEQWHLVETSIAKAVTDADIKIVLDVGGKRFATTKTTLLRFPGTYFTGLLGVGNWKPNDQGEYFIDRNPKGFDYVLDYLRSGELDLGLVKDPELAARVMGHMSYFLLPKPNSIRTRSTFWCPDLCSPNLKIKGGRVKKGERQKVGWNSAILGSVENPASFKVRLLEPGTGTGSPQIMVGLAPRANFNPNGLNHSVTGFYFFLSNGSLWSEQGQTGADYRRIAVAKGSVIEVIYSTWTKSISFKVDNVGYGVAYKVTSVADLYPAVEISSPGGSLEMC